MNSLNFPVVESHNIVGKRTADAKILCCVEKISDDKRYECTVCQEMLTSENELTKHYKDHMEKNLFMCVSEYEQSVTNTNEQTLLLGWEQKLQSKIINSLSQGKYFECDVCHRKFSFKSSLKRHYSVHAEINLMGSASEEKKLTCCVCRKSFLLDEQLRRHYRCHVKPHECDVCHKKFPFKSNLMTHYRTHLDMASRTCPVCLKSFSSRRALKFHGMTHIEFQPIHSVSNEIIPYDDTIHNRSFQYKTKHINHKYFGMKSHSMETMKTSFHHNDKLDANLASNVVDKSFQCDRCDKSFDCRSILSIHYAVHTRIKRHKCIICFKSFTKTSHLQNHLRIHTGEKPYACNMCERSFSEKGNLIKHQFRHKKSALPNDIA